MEGWYLATFPEHYCTHRCHIKNTSNKKFIDTVNFIHRKLMRTTITHVDKFMAATLDYAKAIKNLGNVNGSNEMKQLVPITEKAIHHEKSIAEKPTTAACEPTSSRVFLNNNNNNN